MAKKILSVDADLMAVAREYVNKQIAIMEKFGRQQPFTEAEIEALAVKCAQYPQQIRNMIATEKRKEKKSA